LPAAGTNPVVSLLKTMELKWRLAHARGYLGLGMIEEASAELDRVPAEMAQATDVLALRVLVLHEQARWPTLMDVASKLVLRQPMESGWWVTWAYATRRSQSLAAAEAILLEGERAHPAEAVIQFNLGCYACQRGDLVEARRRVDRAIALDASYRDAAASDPDLAPLRSSGS
jgi:tetratricopeptide (TPR) repeat protein